MLPRIASVFLLVAPFALGCSASTSSTDSQHESTDTSSIPQTFSSYCVGTLKSDKPLLAETSTGGWTSDGTVAESGSRFLVAWEQKYVGYVVRADGSAARIDPGFGHQLEKGADFDADCTINSFTEIHEVVLGDSHLYSSKDLKGTSCTVQAGTEVLPDSFVGGDVGMLDSKGTRCASFNPAFSKDLRVVALIPKGG
jgi:hypothetical protein